jgi:hypothetical protein
LLQLRLHVRERRALTVLGIPPPCEQRFERVRNTTSHGQL